MQSSDWLDTLRQLSSQLPEGNDIPDDDAAPQSTPAQKNTLEIIVERKGRAGKTATIICGFTCPDSELQDIAADIKRSLGCGGSARCGEILIQGERKAQITAILKAKGFKIK